MNSANSAASSSHDTRDNSNMMLLLSLNLILLSFFILLNSMADFETDRARAVIASVKQAFNGKAEAAGQLPAFDSSLGALPEVEAKMREVGSLFEAMAPSAQAKRIRRADLVRVDVPASALFRPGSLRLRQGREVLLERLAESLRQGPVGAPRYLLEILVGTDPQTAVDIDATAASASLELRRAAVLAARLSAGGEPLDGLSTGLRPAAAGSLRFVVRLRPDSGAVAGPGGKESLPPWP